MGNTVFLVAGGSRGIGEAVAVGAARKGHHVVFSYIRNAVRAAEVVQRIEAAGGRATAVQADTGTDAGIEMLFSAADAQGRLTAFVYSSGVTGINSPLVEAQAATIDEVLAVNLRGAIIGSQAAIRRMSTRLGGQGGSIVLLSSRAALYGSPGEFVWYAASKGGVDSLVRGLARELGAEGIRVNAVSPGPIETEMHRPGRLEAGASRAPMQRAGTAREVADAVLYLASEQASYVTGANLAVAGGL